MIRAIRRRSLLAGGAAISAVALGRLFHPEREAAPRDQRRAQGPDDLAALMGQATYSTDIRPPGLLHAVIARPPVLGYEIGRLDAAETLGTGGVVATLELPPSRTAVTGVPLLGGVAIVAHGAWMARRGRDALRITWQACRAASMDPPEWDEGGRQQSPYLVPDFGRMPMETPSATARAAGERSCAVWACVDDPDAVRADVAACLGVPIEGVDLTTTVLGGSSDRKTSPAYATEAAMLSRLMGGLPVMLTWTREDDIPFRRQFKPPWAEADAAHGRPLSVGVS